MLHQISMSTEHIKNCSCLAESVNAASGLVWGVRSGNQGSGKKGYNCRVPSNWLSKMRRGQSLRTYMIMAGT